VKKIQPSPTTLIIKQSYNIVVVIIVPPKKKIIRHPSIGIWLVLEARRPSCEPCVEISPTPTATTESETLADF
jgi:tRNA A37 threonylcarbamoyladenosine synthetase subunit TsaC/SUA5/YrdC